MRLDLQTRAPIILPTLTGIVLAAIALVGCSPSGGGTGALAAHGGSPMIEIVSANYAIDNCVKSYSALDEVDLVVPGTHSYSSPPQDPNLYMWDCTNTVDVPSTTIDESNITLDYDIAIQTEFVDPPPGTPENPNPLPDGRLIDPRVATLSQAVEFIAHQPVTLEVTAGSDLAGQGASDTQNLIAIEISTSPLEIDATTGGPASGNVYELFYADGATSTGDNLVSELDFDLDLPPAPTPSRSTCRSTPARAASTTPTPTSRPPAA